MAISPDPSIDGDSLAGPVQRLLDDDRARVESWQVRPIGRTFGNPCTVGVDLVRGVAQTPSGRSDFSLVRKVVSGADVPGLPRDGYMAQPGDWNYWKREAVVFESGLLDTVDGPVVPVRCFGVEDHGSAAVMWLEEVTDGGDAPAWTVAEHVAASAALGEFNGRALDSALARADLPWLARDFSRAWLTTMPLIGLDVAVADDSVWRAPALRGVFPRPLGPRIGALLADAEALLSLGSRLPATFTHHDAACTNMFRTSRSTGPEQTPFRLIDWSFAGIAPVGEDLGHQLGVNVFELLAGHDPALWWDYEAEATGAYVAGLRRAGVDVPQDVLRTYARAVAALGIVTFAASHVTWLAPDEPVATDVAPGTDADLDDETPWPQQWAAARDVDTVVLLERWAAMLTWFLDLGDAARRTLEHL